MGARRTEANRRAAARGSTTAAVLGGSPLRLGLVLFAFALAFSFFDTIARTLLIGYAAAILAVVLNTVVRRIPFERKLATGLVGAAVIAGLLAMLFFGGRLLLDQLRGLIQQIPEIEETIRLWASRLRQRTGIGVEALSQPVREAFTAITTGGGGIVSRVRGMIGVFALALVVLFGALFALAKPNARLLVPLIRAIPPEHHRSVRRALDLLGERLLGWAQAQLLAMLAVGLLTAIIFTVIGVPYALLLGVINGLTEAIPILGPWIGGAVAVLVAATVGTQKAVLAALGATIVQVAENTLILPLLMQNRAKVHPFVTLIALLLFGGIFGFLGILLAVPLVLLFWTLVEVFWVEARLHTENARIAPVVEE